MRQRSASGLAAQHTHWPAARPARPASGHGGLGGGYRHGRRRSGPKPGQQKATGPPRPAQSSAAGCCRHPRAGPAPPTESRKMPAAPRRDRFCANPIAAKAQMPVTARVQSAAGAPPPTRRPRRGWPGSEKRPSRAAHSTAPRALPAAAPAASPARPRGRAARASHGWPAGTRRRPGPEKSRCTCSGRPAPAAGPTAARRPAPAARLAASDARSGP